MSKSVFHDQADFYEASGKIVGLQDYKEETLASFLVEEECDEFMQEIMTEGPLKNKVKEAIDLIYVTCQYLNVMIGPDKAQKVWDAVHNSNMAKCTNGKLVFREDGKVLKPAGWKAPDIGSIVGGRNGEDC